MMANRAYRSMASPWLWLLLACLAAAPATAAEEARYPGNLDVPYVPTHQATVEAMLRLAGVGPGDFVIDLGSGDGRILITAVKKYGARGFGVDLDPQRVKESLANAKGAGVSDRAQFHQRNLFDTKIAEASVVTLYLLPRVNIELRPRLLAELKPGTRVVSHDFDMGDWKPDLRATRARHERHRLLLAHPGAGGRASGSSRSDGARQRGLRARRPAEVPGDSTCLPRRAGKQVAVLSAAARRRRDRLRARGPGRCDLPPALRGEGDGKEHGRHRPRRGERAGGGGQVAGHKVGMSMFLYAATIFLSAFLLFLVQPVIAKQILPWFGGAAAVWAICLVFFQSVLLFGYAYADWTTRRLTPRRQAWVHMALLAREPRPSADHSGRALEAAGRCRADADDTGTAGRDHRAAVLPALDDEPARAGVVLAAVPARGAVSPLRAVELRIAARAALLSRGGRACAHPGGAVVVVVHRLRGVRAPVRRDGARQHARRRRRAGGGRSRGGDRRGALGRGARAVGGALGDGILHAACGHQPPHAEHRVHSVPVGGSALASTSSPSSCASTTRAGTAATCSCRRWPCCCRPWRGTATRSTCTRRRRSTSRDSSSACMFCHGELDAPEAVSPVTSPRST